MAKISAKNATILINGSKFSTFTTAYEITDTVDPLEATGFADESKNYVPGLKTARITADMLWDSTATTGVHAKLSNSGQTGLFTLLPEMYAIGTPSISLPYMQTSYRPQADVAAILQIGTIEFESYGSNNGIENGVALYSGTITDTTTSSSFDNGAATTTGYSGIVHVWTPASADSYAIKIQHSANNSTWADLATFTVNGQSITAERKTGTSVNRYRRIVATRTGSAGDSFGFSVVLYSY
jgi:hypothetical protein